MKVRKRLLNAAVLAAVLAGLVMLLAFLSGTHRDAVALYNQQFAQLEQRTQVLQQQEAELAALVAAYEAQVQEAESRTQVAQELMDRAQALEQERDALLAETEALLLAVTETRQKLMEEDGDPAYYLEVYDALTEGLNKVKGYIADR